MLRRETIVAIVRKNADELLARFQPIGYLQGDKDIGASGHTAQEGLLSGETDCHKCFSNNCPWPFTPLIPKAFSEAQSVA